MANQDDISKLLAGLDKSKTTEILKKGIKNVSELDAALLELNKTISMTASEMEAFYNSANETAKQMGVSTNEIIEQASAWGRLGYTSVEAASQMAKLSSQFKALSSGMSSEDAASALASIMEAYGMEAEDALDGIISKINAVGTKFSLNNADIAAMLQDSVSAMAEGNNTLEETIALESAAFKVSHDQNIGQAFKAVSLRLRGFSEETEELDGSLKNIAGDLYGLTGISIMQDTDTYKSTYQVFKEMSEVWDSLSDAAQSDALGLMFGKFKADTGAAVLTNFEAVQAAMDGMAHSAGNADAALSAAMDSIDHKLNRLQETGTGIFQNLLQRGAVKNVLDLIAKFANGIDFLTKKLGALGTAGVIGGGILSNKNAGRGIRRPAWYACPC